MTETDIDTIVGRTDRELREAKKRLAAYQSQAAALKNFAETLTNALRSPDGIVFENQSFDEQHITIGKKVIFRDQEFSNLNPPYLRSLGENIRTEMATTLRLAADLRKLRGEDA